MHHFKIQSRIFQFCQVFRLKSRLTFPPGRWRWRWSRKDNTDNHRRTAGTFHMSGRRSLSLFSSSQSTHPAIMRVTTSASLWENMFSAFFFTVAPTQIHWCSPRVRSLSGPLLSPRGCKLRQLITKFSSCRLHCLVRFNSFYHSRLIYIKPCRHSRP